MDKRQKNSQHVRQQLDRTRTTYLMMREVGFDKRDSVQLRFAYRPSDEDSARLLSEYLRDETSYEVESISVEEGWMVKGTTNPSRLDAASLGRWVYWMCRAGFRHDCLFDGWGARINFNDGNGT